LEIGEGVLTETVSAEEVLRVLPLPMDAEVEDAAAEVVGDVGEVVMRIA